MKNLNTVCFDYDSSLTDMQEVNSSFDRATLQIAYAGKNRNGSYISREAFENSIRSIYNCPIVCAYDRETDTLGGHDVELVNNTGAGEYEIVNVTTPVGVIPESAKVFWRMVEEADGTEHEYLCAEALIWKRQEAYRKLKEDGITSESMEINVLDGGWEQDTYHIYDFEFTAFTLIGIEPCFEGASIRFSKESFEEKLSQMMTELEYSFGTVGNNKSAYPKEGGKTGLKNRFELDSNIRKKLQTALESVTFTTEDGFAYPKYWLIDFDMEQHIVYAHDEEEDVTYGFPIVTAEDGGLAVDFENGKQVKMAWVDVNSQPEPPEEPETALEEPAEEEQEFEQRPEDDEEETEGTAEGTEEEPAEEIADDGTAEEIVAEEAEELDAEELKSKYEAALKEIELLNAKLSELGEYKLINELSAVFDEFTDLDDVDEYRLFRNEFAEGKTGIQNAHDLREACYAIRGRNCGLKFSRKSETPRLKVASGAESGETDRYGRLIEEYSRM